MRQSEAEQEAEQRNLQDERRDRLVFYALDESAGLSEDAWQVATRLRHPEEFQWELPADPPRNDLAAPAVEEPAPSAPVEVARAPLEEAVPPPQPIPTELYELELEETEPRSPDEPAAAPAPRPPRAARLIRAWGYFVMLVGVVFVAATLAVSLGFRTYLQIGPLIVVALVAVGVFAIWVGAQIAKPPR